MDNRKCCSCDFGYNHLTCTACRYMYCDICINLNHHGSTIDYYLKELYSYERLVKLIDKGIINNDELLSESDKYI